MVEWKELGKVCTIKRGKSLSKADKDLGDVPFILYGELYTTYGNYIKKVVSYTSEERACKAPIAKKNDLLLPISSTTKEAQIGKASALVLDYPVHIGGDALILSHSQNAGFLVNLINGEWFEKRKMKCVSGTTVTHLSPGKLADILIPIPSLSEQNRIVDILDTFTSSIDNLKEQIIQRRKQYEYNRDQLLDLEGKESVVMKVLSEVCETNRGVRVVKNELQESGLFPVFQNSLAPMGYYHKCNYDKPTPFVITAGAAGEVGFCDTPFWAADDCLCLTCSKTVLPKYVFYFLAKYNFYLKTKVRKGAIPRLSRKVVESLFVPVIDIESQNQIIDKLETFEASIKNIEAQLELRQKQYEYYRNKLLTF